MEDPRVPALRQWFSLNATDGDTKYDKTLSETIAKFQKEHDLAGQRPAHPGDARRHQRTQAREDRRHHHRQHGALALDAARPRQDLRDGQHPGLHAARRPRRQAGLEDQGRGRQAGQADAAAQRGDEVHHRQPDLERAAVDHPERIPAGAAAGSAGDGSHRAQGRAESRRHRPHLAAAGRPQRARPHPLQLPQQVPGVPARHPGQVPVRP